MVVKGGGGGVTGGLQTPVFCATFSYLLYFRAPLSPNSGPSLYSLQSLDY